MFKLFFVLPFVGQSGRGWWGKHLGGAGVFIPYLYLFCISKSKIGVESGLTGFVCSDWRCNDSASRMQSKLALDCWGAACLSESKVTAVFGSFQQISCFSPRVVMTPARFAWHPFERLSYVSCQGEKSAKNMLNNGLMMAPFHFASFIPLPRLLSLSAYKITTFLQLTSSQLILTHPNSSIIIQTNPNLTQIFTEITEIFVLWTF